MPKYNPLYKRVSRNKDSPDTVSIEGETLVKSIRFSAQHAEHIVSNRSDPAHKIYFSEIVELVKNSIVVPVENKKKYLAIGRHKGKIYETYFYLDRDRIDIITSFMSNKYQLQQLYKHYENGSI
jgi:hypothetical protein